MKEKGIFFGGNVVRLSCRVRGDGKGNGGRGNQYPTST